MTSVATESSWMGAFSPVTLTNVLKRVADESLSGELQIVSGNWVKTIRIDAGAVRFAKSNMRQDRLGESMLAHESISKNDYRLASERMANDGCRFGEALLKMGRLDRKQLHRELGVQVQRIVLSLFRLSEGLYSFEEVDDGPAQTIRLPYSLSVPPLLLKGLRRVEDGRLILSALPPADTIVRMAERPPYNLDLSKLATIEQRVLEKAGAGNAIGSIVRDDSVERSVALRACYALLALGLLEIPTQESESASEPEPEPETAEEPVEAVLLPETPAVADEVVDDDEAVDFARAARIEQLERDAKLHLQVRDWNGAISLLHELVTLSPNDASFQMMLGQAMQFHPTQRRSAEEHFLQAVELAPNDARVHVALGRYYQRIKSSASATAALERALELDPTNADAKRYLEQGREPTRMSRLVKRLFG